MIPPMISAGSDHQPLNTARLQTVDISRTSIQEIAGSAFAGCSQLQCIKLSNTLRRIGRKPSGSVAHWRSYTLHPPCFASTSELLLTVHSSADSFGWARKARKERGGGLMLSTVWIRSFHARCSERRVGRIHDQLCRSHSE